MESNKHNIEIFERFLREKTDEFRMYPSKKVWYSIYNNMHPGNRFPSVSMCIVLIGFLFLIGYLNTDATKETSRSRLIAASREQSNPAPGENTLYAAVPLAGTESNSKANIAHAGNNTSKLFSKTAAAAKNKPSEFNTGSESRHGAAGVSVTNSYPDQSTKRIVKTVIGAGNKQGNTVVLANANNLVPVNSEFAKQKEGINVAEETNLQNSVSHLPIDANTQNSAMPSVEEEIKADTKANTIVASVLANTLSEADKGWMEDFAMHNRPAKKWAGKLGLQVYVTPSVVYRKLHNNAAGKTLSGNSNTAYNNFNAENAVTHKPSFGVEAGISLQYGITRRIKIKGGVQANYTRYNAHAFATNHPIATTITLNSTDSRITYEQAKMSNYSNNFGISPAKLHNETYQLSLPVGADYKLAASDNIAWYAGATVQPTFVVYGRSYIISSDRRSYVQDNSLLNRFNLNAGFETNLSYNRCGYTLQLGPQYRSQIFSTNSQVYTVEERLQNFGFKIGVTKKL